MESKITFFAASLRGGGAERSIVNLINNFTQKKIPVDLVLVSMEGPFIDLLPAGIGLINLDKNRVFQSTWGLVNYLKSEQPSILISTMPHVNIVAIVAKLIARVKTKNVIRDVTTINIKDSNAFSIKSKLISFSARKLYPKADYIVAVSKGVAEDLSMILNIPFDNINIIYDPIVDDSMLKLAEEQVTHPWFKEKDIKLILAAGRLTPKKDFPTLLKAFSAVRQRIKTKLIILGEGPERSILEYQINKLNLVDNVDLPGFISNPFNYMKNADLFVLSSKVEGLPNVLIQAMAVGTPVVATNCHSGPAEILENGRYGPLVPVGDSEALAEAMLKILEHPPDPLILKTGVSRFSVQKISDDYIKLISNRN